MVTNTPISSDSWLMRLLLALGAEMPLRLLPWEHINHLELLPLVAALKSKTALDLPEHVRHIRRHQLQRKLLLRTVTTEVASALDSEVPVIVLKGEPLAQELFPGNDMRTSGDIDLLVLPGDLEVVQAILDDLGFEPDEKLHPALLQTNKERSFKHRSHGVCIDLHWALTLPTLREIPPHQLFETRRYIYLQDRRPVPVLRHDWLLLHLALHFFNHLGFVRGLVDIAAWLDTFAASTNLEFLTENSQRYGLHRILQWPLHILYRLTKKQPLLFDEDPGLDVHIYSCITTAVFQDCLCKIPSSKMALRHQLRLGNFGTGQSIFLQCLLASLIDGEPGRLHYALKPLLFGPHSYGRRLIAMRQ